MADTVHLPRPRGADQGRLPPAGVVHTEHVDVPLNVLLLHHLPEQLPGHVAPVQADGQVEAGLTPEGEAEVEPLLGQRSDGGETAGADGLLELAQLAQQPLLSGSGHGRLQLSPVEPRRDRQGGVVLEAGGQRRDLVVCRHHCQGQPALKLSVNKHSSTTQSGFYSEHFSDFMFYQAGQEIICQSGPTALHIEFC